MHGKHINGRGDATAQSNTTARVTTRQVKGSAATDRCDKYTADGGGRRGKGGGGSKPLPGNMKWWAMFIAGCLIAVIAFTLTSPSLMKGYNGNSDDDFNSPSQQSIQPNTTPSGKDKNGKANRRITQRLSPANPVGSYGNGCGVCWCGFGTWRSVEAIASGVEG